MAQLSFECKKDLRFITVIGLWFASSFLFLFYLFYAYVILFNEKIKSKLTSKFNLDLDFDFHFDLNSGLNINPNFYLYVYLFFCFLLFFAIAFILNKKLLNYSSIKIDRLKIKKIFSNVAWKSILWNDIHQIQMVFSYQNSQLSRFLICFYNKNNELLLYVSGFELENPKNFIRLINHYANKKSIELNLKDKKTSSLKQVSQFPFYFEYKRNSLKKNKLK